MEQKKMKEHQAMVAALRRVDGVVTQGGIKGKVTKVKEGETEIEVEIAYRLGIVSTDTKFFRLDFFLFAFHTCVRDCACEPLVAPATLVRGCQ